MNRQLWLLPLILSMATACGGGGAGEDYTERLIDGVLEREYTQVIPPQVDPYDVIPSTVFGLGQGADTYFLVRPMWLAEGPDRSLYIYDQAERTIHRFSAAGDHLGAFGRRGAGPGEFMALRGMHFVGGRLQTYDPNLRRLSLFSPEGELNGMTAAGTNLPRSSAVISRDAVEGAHYLGIGTQASVSRIEIHSRFTLIELDEELEPGATLIDSTVVSPSLLLADRPFVSPFQSNWFLSAFRPGLPVAWTMGELFRIEIHDPSSHERRRLILNRPRRPITEALRETVAGQYAQQRLVEAARRALATETHLPQVSGLQWDTSGRLWVQAYAPPVETSRSIDADVWPFREFGEEEFDFDVFDRTGNWLFHQDLPGRPGLITAELIYLPAESADGTPIISSYSLQKRNLPE